jgi:hypothetical protein
MEKRKFTDQTLAEGVEHKNFHLEQRTDNPSTFTDGEFFVRSDLRTIRFKTNSKIFDSYGFSLTDVKTANYTAESGEHVLCDTSGGGFTVTLPSSPSTGFKVRISDVNNSFSDANPLTVGRNSQNIINIAEDFTLTVSYTSYIFLFISGYGWIIEGGISPNG